MYDYNYTLAASLGFEAAMADTDILHEGPRTTTACTARYFNATHSTTVTEVSQGGGDGGAGGGVGILVVVEVVMMVVLVVVKVGVEPGGTRCRCLEADE